MNATPENRKEQRNRYYRKHSVYGKVYGMQRYSTEECDIILGHKISDVEIAKKIRRSVKAIQIKRGRLKTDVKIILTDLKGQP